MLIDRFYPTFSSIVLSILSNDTWIAAACDLNRDGGIIRYPSIVSLLGKSWTLKMSPSGRLPVNTANEHQSIWRGLGRDTFRGHIVALQQASREIPSDPVVHSTNEWLASRSARHGRDYSLPFDVEQRLVDDIAFIAAAEEGPKEVSAVALEEEVGHKGLIFRVAANEKLPNGVEEMLKSAFHLLSQCASRSMYQQCYL